MKNNDTDLVPPNKEGQSNDRGRHEDNTVYNALTPLYFSPSSDRDNDGTERILSHGSHYRSDLNDRRADQVSPKNSFRPVRGFLSLRHDVHDLPSPIPSPSPTSHVISIIPQSPRHSLEVKPVRLSPLFHQIEEKKGKSRKEKSLNVLCDRFINHFKESANGTCLDFQLDQLTIDLGVEKRRLYDIVNVLESINIVKRRAASLFTWNGFDHLPSILNQLRLEGLKDESLYSGIKSLSSQRENLAIKECISFFCCSDEDKKASTTNDKKEKMIIQLAQKFVQLFLATRISTFSHDQVVQILIKNQELSESGERTKIRRLYDISNILTSVNLIHKTYSSDFKKQVRFEWIGTDLSTFDQSKSELDSISIISSTASIASFVSEADVHEKTSNVPLKKRKRQSVISSNEGSSKGSTTDKSQLVWIDNNSISSSSIGTMPMPPLLPPPSSQNQRFGLNFQFRSPPSKKNKFNNETSVPYVNIAVPLLPSIPFPLLKSNDDSSIKAPFAIVKANTDDKESKRNNPIPSLTQQISTSENIIAAVSQRQIKQPLKNITNRNVIEVGGKSLGSLSFRFSTPDNKKREVPQHSRSYSFKIGEKISISTHSPESAKLLKLHTNEVSQPLFPQNINQSTTGTVTGSRASSIPVVYDVRNPQPLSTPVTLVPNNYLVKGLNVPGLPLQEPRQEQ